MFTIALNFEDGVSRFIQCNENEKVLDAAYRQKINLPMDCSDGVCGTCKCRCERGEFDLGDEYLEEALSDQERDGGLVLTCQMVPSSDCTIAVPVTSSMCKTGVDTFRTDVIAVENLSPSTIELCLRLSDRQGLAFLSGQYVNIQLPGTEITRAYSFSSAPGADRLSFLIRNVPNGLMSSWLSKRARPGDALTLTGPQGSFYLRAVTRPVLMLAGGTGLAPFLSMLRTLARGELSFPVHLVWGVNRDSDRVKLEELASLAQQMPLFSYRICVADSASTERRTGYVTQHIDDGMLNDGDVDVYLCGPPPMVEAVMSYLQARALAPQNFYYEKFTPQAAGEAS
ncbi:benzoate 1,2-dioxygenase electron transfer component BenC [Erwinia tasmaniensis]|uniref:benzoate 1,2-dioxygenase electron transfer component BenC n=1 Tax=Erwinia tasmaniensis TaxID=338565 RepID=UPI003A4E3909